MNFLVSPIQPAAGAAGLISRVQLPATGRTALTHPALRSAKGLPVPPSAEERNRQRDDLARNRSQHRAQCRANCMSKANF